MHCRKCGREIKRSNKFCKYCGTKQYSLVKLFFIQMRSWLTKVEIFIAKHFTLILIFLLTLIITLQILELSNINTIKSELQKSQINKASHRQVIVF